MKFLLVLFALIAAVSAITQSVDLGYKSSQIATEDGDTNYFTIDISEAEYMWCDGASGWCMLEIIYSKNSAGTQEVCIGETQLSECTSSSGDNFASLGATDITDLLDPYTYSYYVTSATTVYVSVTGTCDFTSDGCFSTTDAAIDGVRLYEGSGSQDSDGNYATRDYIPFWIDDDGSNTAYFDFDMDSQGETENGSFAYPSMLVELWETSDLYILLDIDEIDDFNYAVEFHYTMDMACGTCTYCSMNCSWDAAETMSYIRYPSMQDWETAETGSYSTGPISLTAGNWSVTPMVWNTELGFGELNFRFCGGVNFECESAAGLIPSLTIMIALLAALFLYF